MRRIGNGVNDTEFLKLHADVLVIGRENAKRTDVHRKNGIIVNEGRVLLSILSRVDNMTPQEVKQRRMYNLKKYGLSNEEIDKQLEELGWSSPCSARSRPARCSTSARTSSSSVSNSSAG